MPAWGSSLARGRNGSAANNFNLAAGLGDFLFGRLGKLMRLHCQRRLQFAIAQHLDQIVLMYYAVLDQEFRSNVLFAQLSQAVQVHHLVFHAENIGEAALGQAAMQWHLAAFKAAHHARA